MIKHTGTAATFAALLFFIAMSTADCAQSASGDIFKNVQAGVSYESVQLGKKPTSLEYSIDRSEFFVGKENATRFFLSDNNTNLKRESATKKYSTTLHTKEYGIAVSARLHAAPRQSFTFAFSRKKVHTDPYIELTWMPLAGAWNPDPLSQAGVWSHPFSFDYTYKAPRGITLNFGYTSEKTTLETPANLSVRTRIYTLGAKREWKKFDVETSWSKFKSDKAPANSLLEFGGGYKPWKFARIYLKAGLLSHGVPTAGGHFSDIGEQFIFSYLGGMTEFNPIFSEKVGYYSLGINLALPAK